MKSLTELLNENSAGQIDVNQLKSYFHGIYYWFHDKNADQDDMLSYGPRGYDPDHEQVIDMRTLMSPGSSIVINGQKLAGGELVKIQSFLKNLWPALQSWEQVKKEADQIDELIDDLVDLNHEDDEDSNVVTMPQGSLKK